MASHCVRSGCDPSPRARGEFVEEAGDPALARRDVEVAGLVAERAGEVGLQISHHWNLPMDTQTKRVLCNVVAVVESLKACQSITREEMIDRLRRRVPADDLPSEPVLGHAFRHLVLNAGIRHAYSAPDFPGQ